MFDRYDPDSIPASVIQNGQRFMIGSSYQTMQLMKHLQTDDIVPVWIAIYLRSLVWELLCNRLGNAARRIYTRGDDLIVNLYNTLLGETKRTFVKILPSFVDFRRRVALEGVSVVQAVCPQFIFDDIFCGSFTRQNSACIRLISNEMSTHSIGRAAYRTLSVRADIDPQQQ